MASNEEYLDNLLNSVLQPASVDSQPEIIKQENSSPAEISVEPGQVFEALEEINEIELNPDQQSGQDVLKELEVSAEDNKQEEQGSLEEMDLLEPLNDLSEYDKPDEGEFLSDQEIQEGLESDFEDNVTERLETVQDQDILNLPEGISDFDSMSDIQQLLSDYEGAEKVEGSFENSMVELQETVSEGGMLEDNSEEYILPEEIEISPVPGILEENENIDDIGFQIPDESEILPNEPEMFFGQDTMTERPENSSEENISDIQDLLSSLDSLEEPQDLTGFADLPGESAQIEESLMMPELGFADDLDLLSGDLAPKGAQLLTETAETSADTKDSDNFDVSDFLSGLEEAEELPMTDKKEDVSRTSDVKDYQGMDMSDMDALLGAGFGIEDVPDHDTHEATQESSKLSLEEIENLLEANKTSSQTDNRPATEDMADISDLLRNEDDDEALQEITDLLKKSDSNEAIDDDMLALLQSVSDDDKDTSGKAEEGEKEDAFDLFAGDTPESPEDEKARKAAEKKAQKEARKAARSAAKKKKKKGQDAEEPEGEQQDDGTGLSDIMPGEEALPEAMEAAPKKNKGFLAKILDLLTEEEDEDDEEQSLILSDENAGILKDMDKEGKKGKKAKGANKKGNASKGKDEDEKDPEGKRAGKGKDKKPKKEPKKKKEKPPKEPSEDSGKKLSGKRVGLIAFMCLTLCAAIFIVTKLSNDYSNKRSAQAAYYREDYETCYQELFGKKRNESEEIMFYKSQSILQMQMYLQKYDKFQARGSRAEALDVLVQAVKDYPSFYENASQWEYVDAIAPIYQNIVSLLQEQFSLTEGQALEIAAQPDDSTYTKMITDMAAGAGYGQGSDTGADKEQAPGDLEDMLEEETQLEDVPFVEGN